MEAKIRRAEGIQAARRNFVLDAAREVVRGRGLERASMREIAKAAGYTPGALYAHFKNRQALLTALLVTAMQTLHSAVLAAKPARATPDQAFLIQGDAWLSYLLTHASDRGLLLHFLDWRGTRSLPPAEGTSIHTAIRQTLEPLAQALAAQGLSDEQTAAELEALLAHGVGVLLAHAGDATSAAGSSPRSLYEAYLRRVWSDLVPLAPAAVSEAGIAQVDLFG